MASVVVIGAGVIGSALALRMAREGWAVTLVDAHEPGHARAASAGDSRLIRYSHGADRWYTRSAWRARSLWREIEEQAGTELLVPAGLVWLARRGDGWEADSERVLAEEGVPARRLDPEEAAGLFPSLSVEDLSFALLETEAGVLRARRAVRAVVGLARDAGAEVAIGRADPLRPPRADRVVWACGSWLSGLFPEHVLTRVTKQDYFMFGAGAEWRTPGVPAWVDYDGAFYGLGDLDGRGVKVAPDREGEPFDPENGRRAADPEGERAAREYLAHRFPALADAPLIGTRTCQYAVSADSGFIAAPHPEDESAWLVGGDSGHAFKHAPALAERLLAWVSGEEAPDPRFGLGQREPGRSLRTAGTPDLR